MAAIDNDLDLPSCLDSLAKREEWAKTLLKSRGHKPIATSVPFRDGAFSRTLIVRLEGDHDQVVQFRRAPLDIAPFLLAREHFGDIVPEVKTLSSDTLEANGVWVYILSLIPGTTWLELDVTEAEYDKPAILRSLGGIFSKGLVAATSESAMDYVRNHLDLIVTSKDPTVAAFRGTAEGFITKLPLIKTLPLYVSHHDLNDGNILIDKDLHITGIVDWENSRPLPFGMGSCRIHGHAGEFDEGLFCMPENYGAVEAAYWQSLWQGLPEEIREGLETKLHLVQDSVALGMLLETFGLERDGSIYSSYNPVIVGALGKLLTYRIPFLRKEGEPPYLE